MATVRGGKVLPHVQRFADDCQTASGASNYGTYNGHSPSIDRALDIFHAVGDDRLPDAICKFAMDNYRKYGVDYIISRQKIWNPEISNSWRNMSDRGDNTQNHFDHVHISFESKGEVVVDEPIKKEDVGMFRYVWSGVDWVVDRVAGKVWSTGNVDQLRAVDKLGAVQLGAVDGSVHRMFMDVYGSGDAN